MFWLGLAAGVLVPLGLVPICATVLLRRWLANEGFEDPDDDDDDDDDEFDWDAPRMPTVSQEDFEAFYRRTHPQARFGDNMVALPCTCSDGGGPTHWAAIRNAADAIEAHRQHEQCLRDLRRMESNASDPRGGQHATPAPVPELQPGEIVALADDVGEVSDRLYVVAACKGAITAVDPVDGGPRQFAKTGNVRRLGEQHASPVHGFGDCVPGLPRRTDAELDSLVDTIRRNG